MKLLSEKEILTLVEVSPESDCIARENLVMLSGAIGANLINDMFEQVKRGELKQTEIQWAGWPVYAVYWFKSAQEGLNIVCAASLDKTKNDISVLVRGVEQLADVLKAKFITFHTRRPGLISQAQKFGYVVGNVEVVKML